MRRLIEFVGRGYDACDLGGSGADDGVGSDKRNSESYSNGEQR
jgi:hypothetical protein